MQLTPEIVLSEEWPNQTFGQICNEHPYLHSRITELQVHTLLGCYTDFNKHEVWSSAEVCRRLFEIARRLNPEAARYYPNRLEVNGLVARHYVWTGINNE